MGNFLSRNIFLLSLCILAQYTVAEEKLLSANASVKEIFDSNFSRTPEPDAERITLSSASISLQEELGRQRFLASVRASHYKHDELSDFDATLSEGKLSWNGQIGNEFNAKIEGVRDAHLADQWEFFEKDIVTKDDLNAAIGYGNNSRLAFHLGGRNTQQTHSNELLERLNFDEEEGFFDAGYKTAVGSKLTLRFRSGNRIYVAAPTEIFDFDYQQIELEGLWKVSQKTSVTGTLGQLERMGIINDGSGNVAAMTVKWEASPKFLIESGYSFNQPAVGETVDAPFQIQTYFIAARWDLTSKITVNSKGTYVERRYEGLDGELERIEALTILAPLVISYEPYRFVNITLDTGWRDNKSPRIDREYSSYQSALSIKFIY